MKKSAIYIALTIVLSIIFDQLGVIFSYDHYKDYLNALVAVSSMIFTIMGIWIAFLYPNALHKISNPNKIESTDFSENLQDTRRLESLVYAVLSSAIILVAILFIHLMYILIPSFKFYLSYIQIIKSCALSLAFTLGFIQLESVFYVVHSNISFLNDLHKKRENREAENDY